MSSIHDGHRYKVRRRFLSTGLEGFEPHNALELMLFYSRPRGDVNELAHRLIERFGGFDRVLEADYDSLLAVEGVGENTAVLLKLFLESYRYYELQRHRKTFVASSTSAAINYALSLYIGAVKEICYLLCLDSRLRLINCVKVSEGSFNATGVSARRVVEIAALNKASSAILLHNHPQGEAIASSEDMATTREIIKALMVIGVDLCDHIIVAGDRCMSLADVGVISDMRQQAKGY